MDPINYTTQVANPFDSALKGFQSGIGISQLQQAQAVQQAALAQQQQKAAVLRSLIANPNPTADDYAKATLAVPELHEQFKQSWDTLNSAQNQSHLNDLTQWSAAIQNGQPQIAVDAMNARAQALEDAAGGPTRESQALKANAQVVQEHPAFANNAIIKPMIFAHPKGKEVIESIAAMDANQRANQLQTGLVDKGIAEASKAQGEAVKANAEAQVAQDTVAPLTEKASLDNRLAELDRQIAAANSETERGRLTLERDKYVQEQKKLNQNQADESQGLLDSANHMIETIRAVAQHPGLSAGTGTGGSVRSFFNSSDGADFRRSVEVLKSQTFLNELGKLKQAGTSLGQVTEAEGAKLERRIANLDVDQSTTAFKNQANVLLRDTQAFVNKIIASGKLPTTGGAVVQASHPVYGTVREGDINRLLKQFPGTTRDQVIAYLNSTGGK